MLEIEKQCSTAYKNYLANLSRDNYLQSEFCEGIRNYWDGDEVFYYEDRIERVDYKYVKGYVSIELVQVTAKYDSWLFNKNIDKIVYYDGSRIYEFNRQELLNFAYFLTLNYGLRRTSTVYNDSLHQDAYNWAFCKLRENSDGSSFRIKNIGTILNSINPNQVHMNIAHNSSSNFSAINIRIPTNLLR